MTAVTGHGGEGEGEGEGKPAVFSARGNESQQACRYWCGCWKGDCAAREIHVPRDMVWK